MDRAQGQYVSRKALAIKRGDSEILNRADVQYDLLYHIFSDKTRVFTDETPGKPQTKVNFCDLYVNALYDSSKCSKIMRDKMHETPAFAIEFAKISLLTNIGRINTTMAFFPEMKTALRSYHPVPSLQKTDGNVQDAPRIKNCLKAALLPSEAKDPPGPPTSITAIQNKLKGGQVPPTSVVNLIFVLTSNSATISPNHFDPPVEFIDLFVPTNMSSECRARAFLWMIYHYHEGANIPNPFNDQYSQSYPGKVPWLRRMTVEETQLENQDPPEEIEWGKKMAHQRSLFLQELVSNGDADKRPRVVASTSQTFTADFQPINTTRRARTQQYYTNDGGAKQATFHHYIPLQHVKPKPHYEGPPRASLHAPPREPEHRHRRAARRSMLQQAWHRVQTLDALADSDDEAIDDEALQDYHRRMRILHSLSSRLWPYDVRDRRR